MSSNVRLAEVSFSGWIISSSTVLLTPHEDSSSPKQPSSQSTLGVTHIQPVSCAYMLVWKCHNWKRKKEGKKTPHKWFSKLQVGALRSALKSRRVHYCLTSMWNLILPLKKSHYFHRGCFTPTPVREYHLSHKNKNTRRSWGHMGCSITLSKADEAGIPSMCSQKDNWCLKMSRNVRMWEVRSSFIKQGGWGGDLCFICAIFIYKCLPKDD